MDKYSDPFVINNLKFPGKGRLIEGSLYRKGNLTRIGKEPFILSRALGEDPKIIDGKNGVILPTVRDKLSWINPNISQNELRGIEDNMIKGGIEITSFRSQKELSRVGWLSLGRKMKTILSPQNNILGSLNFIERWYNLQVSGELPESQLIVEYNELPNYLKEYQSPCSHQINEHRIHENNKKNPMISLWPTSVEYFYADDEFTAKNKQQVAQNKFSTLEEERRIMKLPKIEHKLLGATYGESNSTNRILFLYNLLFDKSHTKKLQNFVLPLRSKIQRKNLIKSYLANQYTIAVGNQEIGSQDSEYKFGLPLRPFTSSILVTLFSENYSSLYEKLLGNQKDRYVHDHTQSEIPNNFTVQNKTKPKTISPYEGIEIEIQWETTISIKNNEIFLISD